MKRSRTRIVATLGPSTDQPGILVSMIDAGADVVRINLSHGVQAQHRDRIEKAGELGAAVLLDTRGPEIRLDLRDLNLESRGQVVAIPLDRFSPQDIIHALNPGEPLFLGDGQGRLQIERRKEDCLEVRVLEPGSWEGVVRITPSPRVERQVMRGLSALTAADRDDLSCLLPLGVDFVALSMVRGVEDVLELREFLESKGMEVQVIAKIETPSALDQLDSILAVSDGLMVARGDLGLRIPPEEVPHVQKRLISRANESGKPVITATQMLESMISSPSPTRAEASDVANAILDGTDAVMLSGESAVGLHPVEAVRIMSRIALRAEKELPERRMDLGSDITITDVLGQSASWAARSLNASAIVTATRSGYTARMVARSRPRIPIVASTPSSRVARQLSLTWGVAPLVVEAQGTTDEILEAAINAALREGLVEPGGLVVFTAGLPPGVSGTTNFMKVDVASPILTRGKGIGIGVSTGKAVLPGEDPPDGEPYIVVCASSTPEMIPLIRNSRGLIAEEGGLTSNAALVGLNFQIPTIVGARGCTEAVVQGQTLTMDAGRGLVYSGQVRLPGLPKEEGGRGCS